MSSNGNGRQPPQTPKGKQPKEQNDDTFQLSRVFLAFTQLPRVIRLVWSTSPLLTIIMALISFASGFLPALSVWITRGVVDSVITAAFSRTHTLGMVWFFVGAQMVVGLGQNLLSTLSNIAQQLLQERVSNRVQAMILEKANTLDLAFFEDAEFYDKLRNASDESSYKPMSIISQLFDFAKTLVTLFSMLFLLLNLTWWLAVIALLMPIPSFISSTRYGWRGYKKMRRQSPERRRMMYLNRLMTTDTYNKEIKLFSLGHFFINQFKDLAETLYQEDKRIVVRRYLASFAWSSLSAVANSAIYIYVALRAVIGAISIGSLTMYTQAIIQVGSSFQGILGDLSGIYESNLFVDTLYQFLEYQPRIVSPAQPNALQRDSNSPGLAVEFRNVSFTYPGKDPETEAALKNVSFAIKAGEAIALVGRNGAGKTTLVKLLTRLYDPDAGQILIGGRDIREYDIEELRSVVGVIFQDYVTYYMSARENIGVGQIDEIENLELVERAAGKSGANAVITKLHDGYATMLGRWFKDGTQLSGGEWQKVALARAFMRNAPILVLDEPTSSLDAHAEYEIFTKFRLLTEGKTAIFISHRFSTVRLADRIFVIEEGVLKESGSHAELLALDGRYAELFNLQAEAYR
ncbi:ABC transporter ATP-binding protein [Ktedonobacter racemifer]|uniref:ABC transporter related protein n=1 Tax=Ktedonobacter racemifer DSM 44963 TaxID=485913 RepID=D6U4F8_KTERA|nr:ABC transporter ATP-binding protein [Ktedonobacter racemifer]EFH81388.1 ABC transporter related protein [Ktedonobacter racemifer DSM 44963]